VVAGQPWYPGAGFIDTVKTSYTRDFGTYIGRLKPQAHGIAGSVSQHIFNLSSMSKYFQAVNSMQQQNILK
jgi:hypothetical protein